MADTKPSPSTLIHEVGRLLEREADLRDQITRVRAEIAILCERLQPAITTEANYFTGTSHSPRIVSFRFEERLFAELISVRHPYDVSWADGDES